MSIVLEGWIWWAAALAIGVPIALIVLTEVLGALARRNHPAVKPVKFLRNWVVPVAALLALFAFAFRSPVDQVWVRVVATLLGFLLILLVLSSFDVALFAQAKSGSWRERTPTIFIEIARLILVIVGLALLFQWVWGADVGGLIAALGVGSIVIGLALQNAVGGVISGLLLLFEQPFRIGDWLDVGGTTGRVIEVNWRAVHLDTDAGIQIIPNSSLSGASFTNLSKPSGSFLSTLTVTFTTDDPPHEVLDLLVRTATNLPMRTPGESATAEYAGNGSYSVSIPVLAPALSDTARSTYRIWLWYAARRGGLALDGDGTDPLSSPEILDVALDAVSVPLHLDEQRRASLRGVGSLERYAPGETIQAERVVPEGMRVIVSGTVKKLVASGDDQLEFTQAGPGEFIGECALTRERTRSSAVASTVVTVLVLPLTTIYTLVQTRPLLAQEIERSLEIQRTQAAEILAQAGYPRAARPVLP